MLNIYICLRVFRPPRRKVHLYFFTIYLNPIMVGGGADTASAPPVLFPMELQIC